jgi:hypothetical protein
MHALTLVFDVAFLVWVMPFVFALFANTGGDDERLN